MQPDHITARLADPTYLDRHLLALAVLRGFQVAPWYDSHFLRYFEAAKAYLQEIASEHLERFIAGFAPLQNAGKNQGVQRVDALFESDVHETIQRFIDALPKDQLERHEEEQFGRQILHDHRFVTGLQKAMLPRISQLVGEPLEAGYSFLCLYGENGICEPHMDEPISMYTLDYCVDSDAHWPIHFSKQVGWPGAEEMRAWRRDDILGDPALEFAPHMIPPKQAILFNGSAHWHYRDRMAEGSHSHLLFFHFHPKGAGRLVRPPLWHDHFDLPVLQPLCDLFDDHYPPLGPAYQDAS
ncbi:MAG: hypothetical protein ABJG26_00640 [Marinomonas sp.]